MPFDFIKLYFMGPTQLNNGVDVILQAVIIKMFKHEMERVLYSHCSWVTDPCATVLRKTTHGYVQMLRANTMTITRGHHSNQCFLNSVKILFVRLHEHKYFRCFKKR